MAAASLYRRSGFCRGDLLVSSCVIGNANVRRSLLAMAYDSVLLLTKASTETKNFIN